MPNSNDVSLIRTVLIYGGAFNPPTVGHQGILEACIAYASNLLSGAEVWLLPSGEHNKKKTSVPREVRLQYLAALIKSVKSIDVPVSICTTELDDSNKTDKIETVARLEAMHPNVHFIWVYGSDSLETMDAWGGAWLKEHTDMLIAQRGSFRIDLPRRAQILPALPGDIEVSSTLVRQAIVAGEPYEHLVPSEVYQVISSDLYR